MQNWSNDDYDDPFPTMPFTNKPKGENAASIYCERLMEKGYSRIKGNNGQGTLIRVLAIGVWDTVGSLGVPDFYNTRLSNKIQHGFHALALDETRGPFTPTLWERRPQEQDTSDLRQVWFPGNHANIGGGWPDQGVANTTLAWMMDQLSSVGCEFRPDALERAFETTVKYYTNQEPESVLRHRKHKPLSWAEKSIYESNKPIRPWALQSIQSANSPLYNLLGGVPRAPGMYKKINPKNGRPLLEFLQDTNERIHPSVRYWRVRRVPQQFFDPVSRTAEWCPASSSGQTEMAAPELEQTRSTTNAAISSAESLQMLSQDPSERWVWEYVGPESTAPLIKMMVEENLGPTEPRNDNQLGSPTFRYVVNPTQGEVEGQGDANPDAVRPSRVGCCFLILPSPPLPFPAFPGHMIGLDSAGKTTIVKKIMNEDINTVSPTLGFIIKTIDYEGYKLNIWDVGGQKTLRSYWRNYFEKTDALIWVVDTTDRLRIDDCREELHGLLQEERLSGASLLVFANKTDIQGCMDEAEILQGLQLKAIRSHRWHVLRCSAVTGENLREGLAWVVEDARARLFLY
ncbi:hypothetical protein E0Z10_g1343 [Xylaria hypoxylon]|uniref:Abnormal eversion of vulva protein 20 n=1 Tax=Xylaria hypoxylon TaxID=37992 RepID=A0A4Z0Z8Y6_9PEZI|nr:hypothetical protein E0Z10_g1343 [Xylaria hypoxylon]